MTTYFTDESFKFLRALARNNDRDWFHAHKADYEDHVRAAVPAPARPTCSRTCAQVSAHFRADPQDRRRLAVPHPSRHALRQRQDAVQDLAGRAPVPRTQQAGRGAVVLPAPAAGQLLRRCRPVASGTRHAAPHPPVHRRQPRQLEGRRACAGVPHAASTSRTSEMLVRAAARISRPISNSSRT